VNGKVTDYAGNFVYEKTGTAAKALAFMYHLEGYVENTNGKVTKKLIVN
jgi:hypothetical protein